MGDEDRDAVVDRSEPPPVLRLLMRWGSPCVWGQALVSPEAVFAVLLFWAPEGRVCWAVRCFPCHSTGRVRERIRESLFRIAPATRRNAHRDFRTARTFPPHSKDQPWGRSIAEGERYAGVVAGTAILAPPVGIHAAVTVSRNRNAAPVRMMALATASARFGAHLGKGDGADVATTSARTGLQSLGMGVVGVIVGFERDGLTVMGCTSEETAADQARRPSAASALNLAVSEHRGGSVPGERGP